eukprot:m.66485 g.66485  ORF g.66485 m.66485 type:complete len:195 (+) comp49888_c0_seq11:165-749(+)
MLIQVEVMAGRYALISLLSSRHVGTHVSKRITRSMRNPVSPRPGTSFEQATASRPLGNNVFMVTWHRVRTLATCANEDAGLKDAADSLKEAVESGSVKRCKKLLSEHPAEIITHKVTFFDEDDHYHSETPMHLAVDDNHQILELLLTYSRENQPRDSQWEWPHSAGYGAEEASVSLLRHAGRCWRSAVSGLRRP